MNQSNVAIQAYQRKERVIRVFKMKYIGDRPTCKSVRVIASTCRFNRLNNRMRAELVSDFAIFK